MEDGTRSALFDPALERHPLWTPDGKALLFLSQRANGCGVYRKTVDADSPEEQLLVDPSRTIVPWSWFEELKRLVPVK